MVVADGVIVLRRILRLVLGSSGKYTILDFCIQRGGVRWGGWSLSQLVLSISAIIVLGYWWLARPGMVSL